MANMFGDGHAMVMPCDGDVGDIMIMIMIIMVTIIIIKRFGGSGTA